MKKLTLSTIIVILIATAVILSGDKIIEKRGFEPQGAEEIIVDVEFGVGIVKILPSDMSEVASVDLQYDDEYFSYELDYEVKGKTGLLDITSAMNRDWDDHDEDIDNDLSLSLSGKYPTELILDMGACEADMDLGGLSLNELDIDMGASSVEIDFTAPNLSRLREITIDAGASSLKMHDIGNAQFDRFTLDGGAGSFDLDFRGQYSGESTIDLDIGLGSADLILPEDIPVHIEFDDDGWFSSVDLHRHDLEEIEDGTFESPGFGAAKTRITVDIEVGMGSVDIYFK